MLECWDAGIEEVMTQMAQYRNAKWVISESCLAKHISTPARLNPSIPAFQYFSIQPAYGMAVKIIIREVDVNNQFEERKRDRMKMAVVVISIAACLSGCATMHKVDAIRHDVNVGRVKGMTAKTKFAACFPKNYHKGPYAEVDDFNVKVEAGNFKGQNATFFLGKSRKTGKWEVFSAMVQKDGEWETIPVAPTK